MFKYDGHPMDKIVLKYRPKIQFPLFGRRPLKRTSEQMATPAGTSIDLQISQRKLVMKRSFKKRSRQRDQQA